MALIYLVRLQSSWEFEIGNEAVAHVRVVTDDDEGWEL